MHAQRQHTISPLFGEIAVELGLCTANQVIDALCIQEERSTHGRQADRIGQILIELGALTAANVTGVMEELDSRAVAIEIPGFQELSLVSRGDSTLKFHGRIARKSHTVVVELLRFGLAESAESLKCFRVNSLSLTRLDHPNLVQTLGVGEIEDIPYLVTERVSGPDLKGLLDEGDTLPQDRALQVLRDVARGLSHAHARKVLHGALRPAAIHLPRTGGAKLAGFSLTGWPSSVTTRFTTRVRMPHYSSPEEVRGEESSARSDIYSLGATFFHILTGRPPFKGRYKEVVRQHLRRPAPDLRVLAPGIGDGVARLLTRMLEKDPGRRPSDMLEVSGAAEHLLLVDGVPEARDPAAGAPGRLKTRRGRSRGRLA
ncbi:MAG: serine/threonine-protein kinase [Planctomycetota bacterium]